jgi:hypothetical protein
MASSEPRRSLARPGLGERYLGIASVLVGAAGVVAICGSPEALWAYAREFARAVFLFAASVFG